MCFQFPAFQPFPCLAKKKKNFVLSKPTLSTRLEQRAARSRFQSSTRRILRLSSTMGHQAADNLVNLFTKSNNDLTVVRHRLEREFQQIYPENANPVKLVSRIKKIQDDLSVLKDQCQNLLAAKQDLIDKAQTNLVGNRNLLRRMQASVGIPKTSDSDDPAYENFKQIIDDWTTQIRTRAVDREDVSESDDINKLLFAVNM